IPAQLFSLGWTQGLGSHPTRGRPSAENRSSRDGFGGTFVAAAAPGLADDIPIIGDERLLILRWRRLATRESPRTAAGPIHSCAGHRCAGPLYEISRFVFGFSAATVPILAQNEQ